MRVLNWGMFLLGIYLVLIGLESLGIFLGFSLHQITTIIGLVAGILILMENSRR